MYLVKKVSEISGVSVRTLHHYDEIGLLSPLKDENGYRYYSEEDMSVLQSILFYKYLGFSLKQIKELLTKGDSELLTHLKNQLILMQDEKQKLLTLINTLKKTIDSYERRITRKLALSIDFCGALHDFHCLCDQAAAKFESFECLDSSSGNDSLDRW